MIIAEKQPTTPVSIVITVQDRLDLTRQCLGALFRHTDADAMEVVVVDDGSRDGSTEELRELADDGRIRLIVHEERRGPAVSRNRGAAAATHPYVLFLDQAVEVTGDWLEPLLLTMDLDPMVGATGTKLLAPDGTILQAGTAVVLNESLDGATLQGLPLCRRKDHDFAPANQAQCMRTLVSDCLLVRSEAFRAAGCFHEDYRAGLADLDLGLSLNEAGWLLVYQPESEVVRFEGPSSTAPEDDVRDADLLTGRWADRIVPDYYRAPDGTYTPAPEFSIRTYARPRLAFPEARADQDATLVVRAEGGPDVVRRCVEALRDKAGAEREIILVDAGLGDGTAKTLRELCETDDRCYAIYNDRPRNAAAMNNQGLAFARGAHVVLMTAHVVVAEGWLEALLSSAEAHPQAGLIGSVANRAPGAQQLPRVGYDQETLADLDLFARTHGRAVRGNDELVLWLHGHCLLVTRNLLARIGGCDERFATGTFEDHDLSLRSFLAGFQSLIAVDSFVHNGAPEPDEAVTVPVWEAFKAKWGIPAETPYGAAFDLERVMVAGFDPVLHFQPLPTAAGVQLIEPAAPEVRRVLQRGEAAFAAGRLHDAETHFRWILRWDETHARAANDLAVVLWRSGRSSEAVAQLQELLADDPDNADALWNLQEIRKEERVAPPQVEVAPTPVDAPVVI